MVKSSKSGRILWIRDEHRLLGRAPWYHPWLVMFWNVKAGSDKGERERFLSPEDLFFQSYWLCLIDHCSCAEPLRARLFPWALACYPPVTQIFIVLILEMGKLRPGNTAFLCGGATDARVCSFHSRPCCVVWDPFTAFLPNQPSLCSEQDLNGDAALFSTHAGGGYLINIWDCSLREHHFHRCRDQFHCYWGRKIYFLPVSKQIWREL